MRSWLYTIVRSKATNLFRRTSSRPATPLGELPESQRDPSDGRANPADRYERNWELAVAHTLLAELRDDVSELNFSVVSMRLVEGRSVDEVAGALDITPEQVRYRCHRMLEKLRSRAATYTGAAFGTAE